MMDRDLIDLIAAWRGDAIDPEVCDRLQDRLRRDEAFQQAFVDEIRMLGMLKAVQSMEPRWLRLQDELGWGPGKPRAGEDREEAILQRMQGLSLRPAPRRRMMILAASIAAALLLAGVGWRLWPGGRREAPVASPTYPAVGFEDGLAMVLKLDGVQWERADEPHPSEGQLVVPGRLCLRSGRATLSMLNGTILIVEGPADLELISHDRIFCHRGKLRALVPPEAEGLVIASASQAVLDLGTEFGLNVEGQGRSRLKVFDGRVIAAVRTGAGEENVSRILDGSGEFELDAAAGHIRDGVRPAEFARPIDLPRPPLALDADYRDTILAARPWGYWRFESLRDGAVPNEVDGRPPLLARGGVGLAAAAEGNRAADFRAGTTPRYLELEGPWQPAPGPSYAVELWFLPEAIDHSALVAMASPPGSNHHLLILEMSSRNRHALHPPGSIRFLNRWPASMEGGLNIYSKRPYVPFRWHHLVAQMDRGRMELFLDGEAISSLHDDLRHPSVPGQVLLGRLSTVPDESWLYRRAFVGLMDEVALYDHPLSVEEIRRHHRGATPKVPGRPDAGHREARSP
jgi:hypothetical protein